MGKTFLLFFIAHNKYIFAQFECDAFKTSETYWNTNDHGRQVANLPWLSIHSWFYNLWNVILQLLSPRGEVSFPALVSVGLVTCFGKEDVAGSSSAPIPRLSPKRLYTLLSSLVESCHHYENKPWTVWYWETIRIHPAGYPSRATKDTRSIRLAKPPTQLVNTRGSPVKPTLNCQCIKL